MSPKAIFTDTIDSPIQQKGVKECRDYTQILCDYGLEYERKMPYLQVGDITKVSGWVLHISCNRNQIIELLNTIIPFLKDKKISFKIPANSDMVNSLVHGESGYFLLGKLVCIYCEDEKRIAAIAGELVSLTRPFKGPGIPSDIHLGGALYTRYGGFNPIAGTGLDGMTEEYIYDFKGNLIKDDYSIPFVLPKGIKWPFSQLATSKTPKPRKFLNGKYLQYSILKSDMKGNVLKAISFKKFPRLDLCLIKEGRKFMCNDEENRDIRDRLRWQYELQKDLSGHIPVPQVIDLFEENENLYFVMQFIEGIGLGDLVASIYHHNTWQSIPRRQQLELIDYTLKILLSIKILHEKGYVHRDITLPNFMIDKKGDIYLIDIELGYSVTKRKPYPPFKLGTQGHMSPEQLDVKIPSPKEDIYGLGASLLIVFTGLHPYKTRPGSNSELRNILNSFIGNEEMASTIAACLHPEPQERPEIEEIMYSIQQFRESISASDETDKAVTIDSAVNNPALRSLIDKAIAALHSKTMLSSKSLWYSKTIQRNILMGNELMQHSIYKGLEQGIAGPIYLLSKAKEYGYIINIQTEVFETNLNYLKQAPAGNVVPAKGGLYAGSAGAAVAVAAGMRSGLIALTEENLNFIRESIQSPCEGLDLATGIAGAGVALLLCQDYLPVPFIEEKLAGIVETILQTQQKEGCWMPLVDPNLKKILIVTGMAHGVAGIAWFLLHIYKQFHCESLVPAIHRSMDWLANQAIPVNGTLLWPIFSKEKEINIWGNDGMAGIILVFIQAYQITGEPKYKKIAEQALMSYPAYRVDFNTSHANGMAGLGEVYLEAYKVFGDPKWLTRASWLVKVLTNMYCAEDNRIYWLVDHASIPTADLFVGNSGIIHFLIRFNDPVNTNYLLCPNHEF